MRDINCYCSLKKNTRYEKNIIISGKETGLENVRNVEFSKPFFSILENCGIIHKMYN